jgi:hypothetical protein
MVQIWLAIVPPDRTAFAQCDLRPIDAVMGLRLGADITVALGRCDRSA